MSESVNLSKYQSSAIIQHISSTSNEEIAKLKEQISTSEIQPFEEGITGKTIKPEGPNNVHSKYIMNLDSSTATGLIARPHIHIGGRALTLLAGKSSKVVLASLAPFEDSQSSIESSEITSGTFFDEDKKRNIYYLILPENKKMTFYLPKETTHQFITIGNAALLSNHPDEREETKAIGKSAESGNMIQQTMFETDTMEGFLNNPFIKFLVEKHNLISPQSLTSLEGVYNVMKDQEISNLPISKRNEEVASGKFSTTHQEYGAIKKEEGSKEIRTSRNSHTFVR